MKDKKIKIIKEWIFGLTILTLISFHLIFFGLPWFLRETSEDFGNISEAERFFAMMLIFFLWFLGMILGAKFCTGELEELESTEKTEVQKETGTEK